MTTEYRVHCLSRTGIWAAARSTHDWGITVQMLRSHRPDSVVKVYAEGAPEGAAPAWEGAAVEVPDEEPNPDGGSVSNGGAAGQLGLPANPGQEGPTPAPGGASLSSVG